ncbi:nucleotidyl transferase AbiEii/AbiGii toxin family protein [Ralstonia solanacearum]|uniref:nucleotidyl transferase AbiEii/AbiGii toxin family protein n=1 Tax=Ralstonia solanacearum TaxID=305 RepID=UPI000181672C|nr:nucleotidyl transferase AbiEii/AbiGii toxin family protein [Ralstonia solanacearum]MDC6178622.1 nucleotidyl transferase AbiEii/AbiGii toxin family protein [Ralstonia solanacearum]MDC6212971.1 nucleotidyl transferase AbiEii/AbiGii toxin family protein [Ralstonia solanacearum]MDC6239835.1 nucleotidyl transferase AbiEii/AbiGii toxin family protein [Ralstonia solanacearum]MDD7801530.1 nucleotidyl transferase AbiEii/AbiGii toxin family protein [Ralstonia solanacearum]TYZ55140.1 nucleotidyl trans
MSRNLAASIRTRLKQHADASKQDFNLTLTQYGLERLLYRLSISQHAANYLLKGALLFALWYDQPHRPTRDADLLGYGPDDIDTAVAAFREISRIEVEDGIAFEPASIRGLEIRKETGYGGVRIDLQAKLDGARIALQVDIGFGDAVTPAPETVDYPTLLDNLPAPRLRAYPKHTVVAEKLHAVCLLGMANTRMKDYFDLWVLLTEDTLDPGELRRAAQATFTRRGLAIPEATPAGLSDTFARDATKQQQWAAFLKKNRLPAMDLAQVVALLRNAFQHLQAH